MSATESTTIELVGQVYQRLANHRNHECTDCGCGPQQLHVTHCQHEECPRCHAQLISCLCHDKMPVTH
jgi:hypothetical protein